MNMNDLDTMEYCTFYKIIGCILCILSFSL